MELTTHRGNFTRVLSTNTTDTAGLTAIADATSSISATEPGTSVATGYVSVIKGNSMEVIVVGNDADNETVEMRVHGVRRVGSSRWTHLKICKVDCTYGAREAEGENEFYADTMTVTDGAADVEVHSNGTNFSDHCAALRFDVRGYEYIYFEWNVGSALNANALYVEY